MSELINLLKNIPFFSSNGAYPPCGMFTAPHIIAATLCFFAIVSAINHESKTHFSFSSRKYIRITAIVLTVLEAVKISHSMIYRDFGLDAWFPLSFCGLFIVALWLAGYTQGEFKRAAELFIAYGCPIGGLGFLLVPTTSLMSYPIWHYFSLYSLIYHTIMLIIGISKLRSESSLTTHEFMRYSCFILPFMALSVGLNYAFGSNLMNLREPFNIPIPFLETLYSLYPFAYTVFVSSCYLSIPPVLNYVRKTFFRPSGEKRKNS